MPVFHCTGVPLISEVSLTTQDEDKSGKQCCTQKNSFICSCVVIIVSSIIATRFFIIVRPVSWFFLYSHPHLHYITVVSTVKCSQCKLFIIKDFVKGLHAYLLRSEIFFVQLITVECLLGQAPPLVSLVA